MNTTEIHKQWEKTAPGWAKWENIITKWMEPATEAMLDMAGVDSGARVLDIACGAGSQTLMASERVGKKGHIIASDISVKMLQYVQENALTAGIGNISTLAGTAEELNLPNESLDAAICRIGLMLFVEPGKALKAVHRALKRGGKMAVVVFSTPQATPFMAKPMQVLLKHAHKAPPAPGQPGIFALGAPGVIEQLFTTSGYSHFEKQILSLTFRIPSAEDALQFLQEAAGAYRAVVHDCSEEVKKAAWAEVLEVLKSFENKNVFEAPSEVIIAAAIK